MKKYLFFVGFIMAIPLIGSPQSLAIKKELVERIARMPSGPNFAIVSAKLRLGIDVDGAYKQIDTLLSCAYGDMFWMYGCAGLYYATQDILRPQYKERIRWCWKHYTPYRGDTENHFLMYYGTLFLMSQAWPDLPYTEWFMGKSSKAIYKESKEYLDRWIDETVRYGQTEWDSPRYGYYYITPLVLLAEYTKDSRMKHRFEMMLEYMLADYAVEYLNGCYCGAHSRVSDECAIDPRSAEMTSYGEYFFEDLVKHLQPDVAFVAMTNFECPDIIRNIAKDRSEPYEHYELKRGRTTLRYTDIRNVPVYKYDYMTQDYCLGSMQGGIVQPIQQQSWSLVFNSTKPHNIVTGLHPYVAADELGMFFPEYPGFMLERIGSTKAGYKDENKWVGGSPYEKIYQKKNILVALYDLPDSVKYHRVDLFIPENLHPLGTSDTTPDNSYFYPGWAVFQYDSTLVGIYMLSKYSKYKTPGGERWMSPGNSSGYVIYCESLREMTAKAFEDKINKLSVLRTKDHLLLQDQGHTISLDRSMHDDNVWLFKSKFLESKKGSGILTMKQGSKKRVLDFRN